VPNLVVLRSSHDVAERAVDLTISILANVIATEGGASFGLAGGSLPPTAYEIIGSRHAGTLDWQKVTFFIGDERCVPFDDPQSSWPAAVPMLDAVGALDSQKLRPRSDLDAEHAASDYEDVLVRRLGRSVSSGLRMSVLWIGMGEDGHTLSLFPNHPSMALTDDLVIPVHHAPKPPPDRVSLSLRAVSGAKHCLALINGAGKADVVASMFAGDERYPILEASRSVENGGGSVTWLLDADATAASTGPFPDRL
jgi:6-phosphogluconolactonase